MAYLGVQPGSRSVRTVTSIVATASQTVFNVNGGYTKGFVDVYKQGLKLKEGVDFTATDSVSVVLTSGATVSDKVEIVAYSPLAIYSVVSKAGDAMTGNLTVPNLISSSNVSGSNGYFNNLKVDSNTIVNSSLTITGNTNQTGDVTLTGNLNLTGSLIITGAATSVTTQSLAVEDSIIIMAANNTTDVLDIGFAGNYDNGSGSMYAGMVRNATDKDFYLFDSYENVPGNDIDLTDPSFNIATLRANFNGNLQSNSISVVQLNATNGNFTSSITLTGDASGYRQDTTTVYGGDAGVGYGRLEYHDNRWIINSGSDSSNVAVFQRGNLVKSWIDNNGAFNGPLVITGTVTANGGAGSANQVLTSNGTGVYWATASGGGSASVAGTNTTIQFNDSGVLGGVANLTYDKTTNILSVGNSTINTVHTANGIIVAGDTGVVPASNALGTTLGTSTARWVVNANTGDFTGTVTGTVANMSTSVNSALLTVGTAFIANTAGAYHTGIVNAASHTTSGFVANTTAIAPTSNTILLGNSIGRFVLSANTGDFTGTVTGTVANMSTSVNSALLTVGTAFIANTTGGYHTGTINAASHTVGSNFIANSTAIVGTGYANVTTSVNSALLTVGASFIANTTGAYHTGLINAASINIGSSSFIANSTAVVIADPLTANGSTGTAGQVLASNGTTGSPYWTTASGGGATVTNDNSTNGTRYLLFANQTSGTLSDAFTDSTDLTFNPSTGTVNAAAYTTTGTVANTSGVYPASNTAGTSLGNTLARWVITANTITTSGLITGGAGLTITGTANADTAMNVGANVNLTTTSIKVGNSTINTFSNSTALAFGKVVGATSNTAYMIYNATTNSIDTIFA